MHSYAEVLCFCQPRHRGSSRLTHSNYLFNLVVTSTLLTGRYWSQLTARAKLEDLVNTGLNIVMPIKYSKLYVNDPPWVTPEFKSLIKRRQEAFTSGDKTVFNQYRNTVNRQRKILRRRYFESKVNHLKKSKPSQWWSSVKRIAGMSPACGSEELLSKLTAFRANSCSPQVLANTINAAFLEPMQGFTRLVSPPVAEVIGCIEPADVLQVTFSLAL